MAPSAKIHTVPTWHYYVTFHLTPPSQNPRWTQRGPHHDVRDPIIQTRRSSSEFLIPLPQFHTPQLNSNHQTRPNHVLIHFIIPHINTHSIPLFLLTVGTKKSTKFQYNRDPFLSSLLQEKPTKQNRNLNIIRDMVEKNKRSSWFSKRLKRESQRWKYLGAAIFKWKSLSSFPVSFFNHVAFKILSLFEAIFLVLTACFFYLMCGCRF